MDDELLGNALVSCLLPPAVMLIPSVTLVEWPRVMDFPVVVEKLSDLDRDFDQLRLFDVEPPCVSVVEAPSSTLRERPLECE